MDPPPEVDGFPSETLPGPGRIYDVVPTAELLCYALSTPDRLRASLPEGEEGIYLFCFVSGRRVGHWQWTWAMDDVRHALGWYRAAHDLEAESGDLGPTSPPGALFRRGGEPVTPLRSPGPHTVDLEAMEPGPEGGEADVTPLFDEDEVDTGDGGHVE